LGICTFATLEASQGEIYSLARTPPVHGLTSVRKFLPDAHLIILIRDGRAIVESGRRSFGWNFDAATRRWDESARIIKQFLAEDPHPAHTFLVRYEDLVSHRQDEVKRILEFLNLDSAALPEQTLRDTPIIGSSDLAASGKGQLHWKPTQMEGFQPLDRFSAWTSAEHRRFDWLAGEMLSAFDYADTRFTHGRRGAVRQHFRTLIEACRPTSLRHSIRRLVRGTPPGSESLNGRHQL
jgi:hypothetical protein